MNCKNCGAAMTPVGGRAYFRCGHCGTFEFPTSTADGVAVVGDVTGYDCPVCNQGLTKAAINGHTVCYCGTCRGFLTTNPDFTAILAHRREESRDASSIPRSFGKEELKRSVGCPSCKRKMDTHPYGGGGNVVVDTCHRCKLIWLDAGEMEVLARHRPKEGVRDRIDGILTPVYDGPPREPGADTGWHWGEGSNRSYGNYNDNSVSLWDIFT